MTLRFAVACLVLLVAVGSSACEPCHTELNCQDELVIAGALPISSDHVADVTIDACRNGVCSTGAFLVAPETPIGAVPLTGGLRVECSLFASRELWRFRTRFLPEDAAGAFADGDSVLLRVASADTNAVMVDVVSNVVYEEVAVNGTGCTPVCTMASIDLPPPSP